MNTAITGVIGINSIDTQYLSDDLNDGINLTFENFKIEHEKFCKDENCIEEEHEGIYENYEEYSDLYIINYVKNSDGLYEPDTTKDYSFIVRESTLQITYSKFFKLCRFCSFCYPDQGYLDSEGEHLTYCLPADYFRDDFNNNFNTSLILTEDYVTKLRIAEDNDMI